MMFSDEEIKEIPGNNFMRPGDEIISIREVCLDSKYDRRGLDHINETLLSNSGKNDLDVSRSLFRDGFFPDGEEHGARFAWTEEDGNIAALVSEPGFGTTGHTTFGKDLDAALNSEVKEADSSVILNRPTNRNGITFSKKPYVESVSSTSGNGSGPSNLDRKGNQSCKIDKADPRSRFHYVKYVKRHGRTIKLWECGICGREFQHQYTLMRHLPTHTDERNFHCSVCGKSFRQLSTLSQHRAIHSADRPYACEVCNKTFNRVSTLISHRKTHSDQKPYRCHLCPKGFHQKGNLRNHLFTHTNERPYRCNICFKGFNQQSNLVCHKNKAHPDDENRENRSLDLPDKDGALVTEKRPDSSRIPADHCEVSSSVGPYLPVLEGPSTSTWPKPTDWHSPESERRDSWSNDRLHCNGVIVDAIKTYHMEVALATKQTPFALLKPDNSASVLVKVIDTKLPGGKQMLVPATAEDLRVGGKIVIHEEDQAEHSQSTLDVGAVQIRVPVVATVVPKIKPGGRLQLEVEEPHHAYTALSADLREVVADRCPQPCRSPPPLQKRPPRLLSLDSSRSFDSTIQSTERTPSPRCSTPPLDLISMDLFEPMECIPMGPQITAVDIEEVPSSDDSDIFIRKFDEETKYEPM